MTITLRSVVGLTAVCLSACTLPPRASSTADGGCSRLPDPDTLLDTPGAVLLRWDVEDTDAWSGPELDDDPAYTRYRQRVRAAGADEAYPRQIVPEGEADDNGWRRELHNVDRAYSGEAGTVRPIRCLESLLFAHHAARHDPVERPTEFVASVLRAHPGGRATLRIYFGAGDEPFPPREASASAFVERDASTSDVQFLRSLAERAGLDRAWITNGLYTLDLPTDSLHLYLGPEAP